MAHFPLYVNKRIVLRVLIIAGAILWPTYAARSLKVVSSAGNLVIVSGGESAYSIVVPASAGEPEKFAAEELQRYLFDITSVKLPIVNVGSDYDIRVGLDPNVDWYSQLNGLREDAFVIRGEGQRLFLSGNTPRGTLYEVYYFLEKYLDCGWITPGDDVVPRKSSFPASAPQRGP